MMNFDSIGRYTDQNLVTSSQTKAEAETRPPSHADASIKRARALLAMQDSTNMQAMNLIQMAETALKNGNQNSADTFAQKVVLMLSTKNPETLIKKEMKIPETGPVKKEHSLPDEKKQTEHTYQDSSNDPGVSFTYPGKLSGPESFLAVPAHEYEHVRHSLRDAILNGERIMALVSYNVRYDPATGEPYMAGGLTRTIRLPNIPLPEKGKAIDIRINPTAVETKQNIDYYA